MAIAFSRMEVGKRSQGKNAVGKAAYNARGHYSFEGNCVLAPRDFNFSQRDSALYSQILLPEGVDSNFQHPEILWNHAESKESRVDSQVFFECVLALPDDAEISNEERIQLAQEFAEVHFLAKGLACQIDIHQPDKKTSYDTKNQALISREHNWHAHLLIPTRRFQEDGKALEDIKPRHLQKTLLKTPWGKVWANFQNQRFKEWGKSLQVDSSGLYGQHHIGPKRMRTSDSYELLQANQEIQVKNQECAKNPALILSQLTRHKSTFTREEADAFFSQYLPPKDLLSVRQAFWEDPSIVQLLDPQSASPLERFTTQSVLQEEEQLLRLCDRIHSRNTLFPHTDQSAIAAQLNDEQKQALKSLSQSQRLSCIQGYAGTGKSHLLSALRQSYAAQAYVTRAFAPDHHSANVLREKGFANAENVHRFLFKHQQGHRSVGRKEVWFIDEAAKLSNRSLLELLKIAENKHIQVYLSGDHAQMGSPERGGFFRSLCERYSSVVLSDIQRQEAQSHRDFVKSLATGELGTALQQMHEAGVLYWTLTRQEAVEKLIQQWAQDTREDPQLSSLIISQSNQDVRALNQAVHQIRQARGQVQAQEFHFPREGSTLKISIGDQLEFRENSSKLGVLNGDRGVLIEASHDCFTVKIPDAKKPRLVSFNPQEYSRFELGYASTKMRAQGLTVDNAYILHGAYSNQRSLYVAASRHSKHIHYYLPREDAIGLSYLKWQASQSKPEPFATDYTHQAELLRSQEENAFQEEIHQLKKSPSFWDKYCGYAYSIGSRIEGSLRSRFQQVKDRMPDSRFYQEGYQQLQAPQLKTVPQLDPLIHRLTKRESVSSVPHAFVREDTVEASSSSFKETLSAYLDSCEKSAALSNVLRKSLGQEDWAHSTLYNSFLQATHSRNDLARRLLASDGSSLSPSTLQRLHRHAAKAQTRSSLAQIQEALKQRPQELAQALFPEAPLERNGESVIIRRKRPIHLSQGLYYDNQSQEAGKLLQLIQKTQNCTQEEALIWAQSRLKIEISQASKTPSDAPFQLHYRPLTHQALLQSKADAPIVLVESYEKAQQLNIQGQKTPFVFSYWNGKAGEEALTNWKPLFGRDVLLQSQSLVSTQLLKDELQKAGVRSLRLLSPEQKPSLDSAPQAGFLLSQLPSPTPASNEILWRVEQRVRVPLAQEGLASQSIDQRVLKETQEILKASFSSDPELCQLSREHWARTGHSPSPQWQKELSLALKDLHALAAPPSKDVPLAFLQCQQEVQEARDLKPFALQEGEGSSYFQEWQALCGKRNASAYGLVQHFPKEQIQGFFGRDSAFLFQLAERHRDLLDLREKNSSQALEKELLSNLEPLLYRLFPEGPSQKTSKYFAFGRKGSLKVSIQGARAGSFYDHENQEGGGLLKLIQRELGKDWKEARDWAQDFTGQAPTLRVPSSFRRPSAPESPWVPVLPQEPAPPKGFFDSSRFKEEGRYAYHNEAGVLLGYTLRRKDLVKGGKCVLPLSYGHFQSASRNTWRFKSFHQGEQRPLYKLQQLSAYPLQGVLIVEGEKTADAAQVRLKELDMDLIAVTWWGGCGAVHKTDWSPLIGKNVYLWPDNDPGGFQAAEGICQELRRLGVRSLKVVDQEILQRDFPTKWDLADPFPQGKEASNIRDLIHLGREKAVGFHLVSHASGLDKDSSLLDKLRAKETLRLVEERMRPQMESQGHSDSVIRKSIVEACSKLAREAQKAPQAYISQEDSRIHTQKLWFQAAHGKAPNSQEIQCIKEAVHEKSSKTVDQKLPEVDKESKDIHAFATDCSIYRGKEVPRQFQKELQRNIQREQVLERQMERQRMQQRELGQGRGR